MLASCRIFLVEGSVSYAFKENSAGVRGLRVAVRAAAAGALPPACFSGLRYGAPLTERYKFCESRDSRSDVGGGAKRLVIEGRKILLHLRRQRPAQTHDGKSRCRETVGCAYARTPNDAGLVLDAQTAEPAIGEVQAPFGGDL